jgi:phosphoenolpyruvate carboxykinase (GTP)
VLEWIFRRLYGDAEAGETPIGWVPRPEDLDTDGLDLAPDKLAELLSVDEEGLSQELEQISEHLAKFGDRLPGEIRKQFEALQGRLG